MSDPHDETDMHKALFAGLVMSMAQSAMMHLGKLANPVTGKTEVDLDGAQQAIDLLDMIAAKTRGNLDDGENRLLQTTLADLKLNFVETAKEQPAPAPAAEPKAPPAAAPAPPAEGGKPDAAGGDSKVRYRKTFG